MEISSGFLLLAAFLYYMDTDGLVLWAALACVCHEVGHYIAIRLYGGRVAVLRLSCIGAEMKLALGGPRGRMARVVMALAGPCTNLLLALLCAWLGRKLGEGAYLFAGLNLGLACFNLLPIATLDGGRALGVFLERWHWGTGLAGAVSAGISLGLAMAGGWLMLQTANPTLLLTGTWLTLVALKGTK